MAKNNVAKTEMVAIPVPREDSFSRKQVLNIILLEKTQKQVDNGNIGVAILLCLNGKRKLEVFLK